MSQIIFENVSKSYGSERVLDGVDLAIYKQKITAVVGPSGGGKSTLLQIINGLVRPETGNVLVFGAQIDYERLPELRRQIGYAVQGTGLFPHMRVWENVTLLARVERWSAERTHERAKQLMELVGLPATLRSRYPHELSGGQRQRVGLCRAMMLGPALFLLDEPFGALDPMTREEIHKGFLRIQQAEPRTIVLVTHDMREAVKLADRIVILDRGRVVQDDETGAIVRRPVNDWVAALVRAQLETGWRDE